MKIKTKQQLDSYRLKYIGETGEDIKLKEQSAASVLDESCLECLITYKVVLTNAIENRRAKEALLSEVDKAQERELIREVEGLYEGLKKVEEKLRANVRVLSELREAAREATKAEGEEASGESV